MDKAAGEALEQLNDTSAIPGLVAVATGVRPPSARRAAKHALQHLLPLVGSDNTKTLTAEQERGLVQLILQNVRFEPLALTALKSLEFIGTGQSAAFIEKLIRGLDSPNDDLVPSTIRTEAQRLLPMLQERKRNEQQMAVLLRPAEPASQELLLRPAAEVKVDAEIEREQLLRPGE